MSIEFFPPSGGGIPTGATANRPSSPSIGDVFYNGTTENLEIYNGSAWVAASAPAAMPTIAVADVGTGVAYGSAQASVTFTESSVGGKAVGFTVSATTGGYTTTSTSNPVVITVGNNGSYSFTGTAYNDYGVSPSSATVTQTLTTIPQSPTIGTATTSSSTSDVTVTWTLGGNGGKNLSSITITPYLNGTTAQTSQNAATTSSTSHTFTGLTMGSAYTFKVKATNANGDSVESSATNSITVPTIVTVNYLVIAGGGGGAQSGSANAGGGGAGGYRTSSGTSGGSSTSETALGISLGTSLTVTVGGGGNGIVPNDVNQPSGANSGSSSQFHNINTVGGGGGGVGNISPKNGGSGGGGENVKATGTAGQGTDGGLGTRAGGGGAANAGVAGGAGNGLSSNITGNSVTRAGGGGTWGVCGGSGGGGGAGGGGAVNTGSGGGGYVNGNPGGPGGSGVVVIRYPSSYSLSGGTGLTFTTNTVSGDKVTVFTAGTGTVNF